MVDGSNKIENKIRYTSLDNIDLSSLMLPKIIRYHDDFADKIRTIRTDDEDWPFIVDGRKVQIKWGGYLPQVKNLLKHFFSWSVSRYDPSTLRTLSSTITGKKNSVSYWIDEFCCPSTARRTWEMTGYRSVVFDVAYLVRSISIFLCEMSLCGWSPDDLEYLKGWSWFGPKSSSPVEHGQSYYLSDSEEVKLVSFFDDLASSNSDDIETLRNAVILYYAYAYGLRPIQIAALKCADVNVYEVAERKTVHTTFYQAKQKSKIREPMLRKIKREWSPILLKYRSLNHEVNETRSDLVHPDSFFNLTPPETSTRISNTALKLIGRPITPTLFRHIAAQRMADLGMGQLELAEFMGHTDTDTCLIYFENSAIQGQIINRALGLSPIYKKIRDIVEYGFVGQDELNDLSDDQQIGGAAHGIPLAGIGGCSIGQSLCELSPAISCYTCPKFLPLADIETHKNVAENLRSVVSQFEQFGRNDQSNPAYTCPAPILCTSLI